MIHPPARGSRLGLVIHPATYLTLIESPKKDHRTLESLWQRLRPALLKIAAGEQQLLLAGDVVPLINLFKHHTACEEAGLLPMADRLLSDAALQSVGRAMRQRRGIA